MSLDALLLAARDTLRSTFPLPANECEVMGGPQPPPRCGARFAAVHPGGGWNCASFEALDETLGFQVTLTLKAAEPPSDLVAVERLAKASSGLIAWADLVIVTLHGSDVVRRAANRVLGIAEAPFASVNQLNGFIEPPRFRGAADAVARGADWFGADADGGYSFQALSLTLTFGDARRVRPIGQGIPIPTT